VRFDDGSISINCSCCGVQRRQKDRDGAIPKICDECDGHQGQLESTRLTRAEAHERVLRRHLAACRDSEGRARNLAERAKDKAQAFWAGRGRLASSLVNSAGRSPAVRQLVDVQVEKWARQYQDRDANWDDEDDFNSPIARRGRPPRPRPRR
jgi:hypothetical protein